MVMFFTVNKKVFKISKCQLYRQQYEMIQIKRVKKLESLFYWTAYQFFINKIINKTNILLLPSLESMLDSSQSFQTENFTELRSILQQISAENESTFKDVLSQYLEQEQQLVKSLSQTSLYQLAKKQQLLQNVIKLSLHLITQIQSRNDQLSVLDERLSISQKDFNNLAAENQELLRKIQSLDEENLHLRSKIQQAETFIHQMSQIQATKAPVQNSQPDRKSTSETDANSKNSSESIQLSKNQKNHTISFKEHQERISQYQTTNELNSYYIAQLQNEIRSLKKKIVLLQSELSAKSSELELSELYFKEKLDIIASNQSILRDRENSISEFQVNTLFKKQLARVQSVQSIQSINPSEVSEDVFSHANLQNDNDLNDARYNRNPIIRRSLMQQFVTDFVEESRSVYKSLCLPFQAQQIFGQIERQKNLSASLSTADNKGTISRGVQTGEQYKKTIRKSSGKQVKTSEKLNQSFLASLFTKKKQPERNNNLQEVQRQETKNTKESQFSLDNSFSNVIKGIFDYATKKIVTERVHKKKSTQSRGNNQYIVEELKPKKQEQSFAKKRKC